jgi:hypothetical protein
MASLGSVADSTHNDGPGRESITYLGNSITAQSAGYRTRLHRMICQSTGRSHREVNAGLGGVGSLACAAMLDWLVLRHRPFLCLVECSAADMGSATPARMIEASVSSILADLQAADIPTALVHLPRADVRTTNRDLVLDLYQRAAHATGVRELNLWSLGDVGPWWSDGVHTTPEGSEVFASAILDLLLREVWPSSPERRTTFAGEPQAVLRLVSAHTPSVHPSDGCRRNWFRLTFPTVAVPVGEQISVTSPVPIVAMVVVVGPGSGVVDLHSAQFTRRVQLWDRWCTRERLQVIHLPEEVFAGEPLTAVMTNQEAADRDAWGRSTPPIRTGDELTVVGFVIRTEVATTADRSSAPWWRVVAA